MKLRMRSAIPVCIMIASALVVRPALAAPNSAEKAAQRGEALQQIVGQLEEKMVRPVERRIVEQDAKRILSRLTDAQIEALVGGEELDRVMVTARPEAVEAAAAEEGAPVKAAVERAVGDPKSDLLFVPVTPCRVIDSRLGGGKLQPGVVRDFRIAGTTGFEAQGGKAGGCGIPLGATTPQAAAVMINFVAVQPEGSGNLRAWPFGESVPLAAVITYDNLGQFFSISNGLVVPITGVANVAADISIRADFNRAHLVADVTGYFTRFPIENFQGEIKSSLQTNDFTTLIGLGDGACHELNSCTVTTDAPGTVIVEAWGQFVMNHTAGTQDRVAIGVETANPVTCLDPDSVDSSDFELPASLGSNPDVDFTVSHGTSFKQPANTTRTYRLSGKMVSGANAGDEIENSRLICTFIPD